MKKILFVFLIITVGILSCIKNETSPTSIEITVKNTIGNIVPSIKVSLFNVTSTEPNGNNPTCAIQSAVSNAKGLAKFDLSTLSNIENSTTLYGTVIEHPVTGEYIVLGSTDITINKNKLIKKDMQIATPLLKYANGYIPTTITSELAISEYNRWKTSQIVACGSTYRPIADPPDETRVEAVGFGMIMAAYAKDKTLFDGIFNYYLSKRSTQAMNMMAWLTTCSRTVDLGSATDGDIDVAFALIVADKQWGGTYLQSAKDILDIIKTNLIDQCTVDGQTVHVLGPGFSNTNWGGCDLTDIQYYTPAFFRVFASVTSDNTWNQLADDTYILLNASANSTTGLVPDWQTASGTPGPSGRVGYYGYDACRVPWRISLDYLWNGNEQARAWCQKVSNWANEVGPTNIVDGYELNGTARGSNKNSAFLGGFSVAAMCNNQQIVDNFSTILSGINDTYWFNLNTRCLYLFTLTGNFWDPLHHAKK